MPDPRQGCAQERPARTQSRPTFWFYSERWETWLTKRTYSFGVDILPERGHAEVICLPKKPKTAWNSCKALWIC
jgi:hypothetical protein